MGLCPSPRLIGLSLVKGLLSIKAQLLQMARERSNVNKQRAISSRGVIFAIIAIALILGAIVFFVSPSLGMNLNPLQASNLSGSSSTFSTISGPANTLVAVSGSASTTGVGTRATQITFSGTPGSFTSPVQSNQQYSLTLPNPATYSVTIAWQGTYSWQTGTVDVGQANIKTGSPSMSENFQASTPNSQITVSGNIATDGQGTQATGVVFSYAGTNYTAAVSNGHYSLNLPNMRSYSFLVEWSGAYQWQSGTTPSNSIQVNQGPGATAQTNSAQIQTPNSIVTVSGNAATTTFGTHPTQITFTLPSGQQYAIQVTNGQYSIQLPNLSTYSVSISWATAINSGTCNPSSNQITVQAAPEVTAIQMSQVSC
jgi:hypothetical protein